MDPDALPTMDTQGLYDRLMAISGEAFDARLYNVAYHALAGALHCARLLPDDEPIAAVGRTARLQLAEIDRVAPDYEHSTRSANARGHNNIFELLAMQATALIADRNMQRQLRRSQRGE